MINPDSLNSVPLQVAAHTTAALLDALQHHPQEAQVAASAAVFLAICRRFGVRPEKAFEIANNLTHHSEGQGWRPEFRAVARYAENEL